MHLTLCAVFLNGLFSHAAPAPLGLKFGPKRDALPTLTLPYATYRASSYNPNGDIYTFKNIRFAAPPVGDLRWAKPAPPQQETEVQDGSYGPICRQTLPEGPQMGGPGPTSPLDELLEGISIPNPPPTNEDCLFLDLRVPGKAIRDPWLKLPVISWFYGGAYIFGGKDQFGDAFPLYDGVGLIQESDGNVIFVSSNYRVGAFGFLAGTTMEKDGLPNTGLYDQRAALQWIQEYIHLVGGDKAQVSAWGESAGAGSILHHLVSYGGTQDPLFRKAVMQSPAFAFAFDRKGALEDTFHNFTALAGCAGQGLACLRATSAEALMDANEKLSEAVPEGTFAVGPSTDGNLIRQLAPLELASGNFYKNIDSLILSHTSNEADTFVPSEIDTDEEFTAVLEYSYPPYAKTAGVNAAIEARYPPVMSGDGPRNYSTQRDRLIDYVGESGFQCNVRFLTNAYDGKNYNLQYSATTGLHAVDLLPTFYNLNLDVSLLEAFPLVSGFGSFAQAYQSYLTSHARSGNPNTYKKTFNIPPAITWPNANNAGDVISGVLDAGDLGFSIITDGQTARSRCDFWKDVAAAVTNLGGYAPPGSVVQSDLTGVAVGGDPSANYA